MKLLGTDNLDDNKLEKLYKFLTNSDNITNKININNLIWSIIYLRKIFNKSIKSKKSQRERVKYNYIITDNDEIICFFSLHYVNKENNITIADLTLLISNKYNNKEQQNNITTIIDIILDEFHKLSKWMTSINILAFYLPNNLNELTNYARSISKFDFAFIDNTTYREECNVYYNLFINDDLLPNKLHEKQLHAKQLHEKQHEYTKGKIIELLMNQYGVNTIINPTREISRKLTRKSMAIPDFKVITKNIFDIEEIQDLPEYDYDYIKVYSVFYFTLLEYFINNKQQLNTINLKNFIKDRFFPGSLISNDNIIQIYSKIIDFIIVNYSNCNVKSNVININYIFKNKVNSKVSHFIKNKLLYSLLNNSLLNMNMNMNKNNKYKIIISNNFKTIEYFNNFTTDIISIKQTANNNKLINEINNKFKSNKIYHAMNYSELSSVLKNINKNVNSIVVDINYANYDLLIGNINIIIKSQFIINTIFNAIKYLKYGGNLIILLEHGYLSTPIFKKIISILLEIFKEYEIITLPTPTINFLIFKNLFKINNYQQNIINQIINKINQYEDKEFKLDDIYNLIISNKFTYKINNNQIIHNITEDNKKYNILFDIENLNIKNRKRVDEFYKDYYANQSKILNINKILLKNDNLCDYLNKYIEKRYISIFKFIEKYKLFD